VPVTLGRHATGGGRLDGVAVQDLRVLKRQLDATEIAAQAIAPFAVDRLAAARKDAAEPLPVIVEGDADSKKQHDAEKKRRETDRRVLRDYFLATQVAAWRDASNRLASLQGERDRIHARSPVTHVQTEKAGTMPVAHILNRGQYDQEGDEVAAAVPGFLPAMPEGAPANRMGLARWLVARENPLTARVAVNRFWQQLFGIGLVETAEDFVVIGSPPVNQELLDWLAVEFIESGWDVKHMFELMVSSAAYRQSATVTPEKIDGDPGNRLLSRGPRFRMDAEMLRDYALASSGLLNRKLGGESVHPYQPPGVWEAVAMPESNTRHFERDAGDKIYRRSLYTFWKRAAPPASMNIFNAPSREFCTVRRERTNTPLQALATMNDPQFVEAARVLASTALAEAGGAVEDAVYVMADRLLLRSLVGREVRIVNNTLAELRGFYRGNPGAATQLLAIGEAAFSGKASNTDLAALTMVANQLMNLDEALNK
jgi:hypothetical protein